MIEHPLPRNRVAVQASRSHAANAAESTVDFRRHSVVSMAAGVGGTNIVGADAGRDARGDGGHPGPVV
jgi:hypothetical protein